MNGHTATDSTGQKWVRNSTSRTYTHCVVITGPIVDGENLYHSHAEWSGRPDLAAKVAAGWRAKTHHKTGKPYTAEVIPAVCTPGQRAK